MQALGIKLHLGLHPIWKSELYPQGEIGDLDVARVYSVSRSFPKGESTGSLTGEVAI